MYKRQRILDPRRQNLKGNSIMVFYLSEYTYEGLVKPEIIHKFREEFNHTTRGLGTIESYTEMNLYPNQNKKVSFSSIIL